MKKTYINPTLEVIKIQTQQMLASSLPGGGSTDQNLSREFDDDDSFFDE